jgi:hypothetical protein
MILAMANLVPITIEWLPMIIGARTGAANTPLAIHSTADLLTTCLWNSNRSLPMPSAELVG